MRPTKEVAMLVELCPQAHARYTSLPLLGPHLEGLVVWLVARGYPRLYIRRRLNAMPRLEKRLRQRGSSARGPVR